jgi:hypothetical protein
MLMACVRAAYWSPQMPADFFKPAARAAPTWGTRPLGASTSHYRIGIDSVRRRFCYGAALLVFVGMQVGDAAEIGNTKLTQPLNPSAGYVCMRLEMTTFMDNAIASLAFEACPAYYAIPGNVAGES